DLPRDREDLASVFEREVGRDQRTTPLPGFDDDGRCREPGDDSVASRKSPGGGLDAGLVLRDDEASFADPSRKFRVRGRIVAVDATTEHGDRDSAGIEGSAVRLAVDALRETADDYQSGRGELSPEHARDLCAVRRAGARTHDRYRRSPEHLDVSCTAKKERRRRVVDLPEQLRQLTAPKLPHRADRLNRRGAHAAASSFGVRKDSASARCSG